MDSYYKIKNEKRIIEYNSDDLKVRHTPKSIKTKI